MPQVFTGGFSNFQTPGQTRALRPSLITLYVQFKDLTGVAANPANPKFQLKDDQGQNFLLDTLTVQPDVNGRYDPTPVPGQPGMYSIAFLPTNLNPGVYTAIWTGDFTDTAAMVHTVDVSGQIGIGSISRTQDFIYRVQQNLRDDHPEEYEVSEPVPQWQPNQLYTYLIEASGRINATGPKHTAFGIEDFPMEVDNLLVSGGVIFALYARSRLEKANEIDYSDGHTLRIARADFYKSLADGMYRDWIAAIQEWKKSTPPRPIGLKSQQLPFRIFRVVGLLPNYQSFFSS